MKLEQSTREELLALIQKSSDGKLVGIDSRQATMLFHWQRHMDDPMYRFVPAKYRKLVGKADLKKRRKKAR